VNSLRTRLKNLISPLTNVARSSYRSTGLLNNGVHFTSTELSDLSEEYTDLEAQYHEKQQSIVSQAIEVAHSYTSVVEMAAAILSELDVLVGFAFLAAYAPGGSYVRPSMKPAGSGLLSLKGARHPCIEMLDDVQFIPNDYCFEKGKSHFQIITGPNMGGKSTYIRQLGAICAMAQIGSFVPCSEATIPVLDCILARVGAGDAQLRGISTFMAEMLEASAILHAATDKSLVIIDELGRGTSTYDGFGLAWAIAEKLARDTKSLCVFATHFHELTAMDQEGIGVTNKHVSAHTSDNSITMLYEVQDGPCLRSFGVHVAELARFPKSVIQDAKRTIQELEDFKSADPTPQKRQKQAENPGAACSPPQGHTQAVSKMKLGQQARRFLSQFAQLPLDKMKLEEVTGCVATLQEKFPALSSELA
jgi:DNA mismatch repair protein MSH2